MRKFAALLGIVVLGIVCVVGMGCNRDAGSPPVVAAKAPTPTQPPKPPVPVDDIPKPQQPAPGGNGDDPVDVDPDDEDPGDVTSEVATANNVGTKGKDYGSPDAGIITTPISLYHYLPDRIKLMQVTRAINLYKGFNEGKLPTSHEQFMKEIVKANQLKLPLLPTGWKYRYDPKRGELMVDHRRGK